MNHFLLIALAVAILAILSIGVLFLLAWSAKKTLIKGETAWSAKSIPINRTNLKGRPKSDRENASSMLESISEQTREYLNYEEELNENT